MSKVQEENCGKEQGGGMMQCRKTENNPESTGKAAWRVRNSKSLLRVMMCVQHCHCAAHVRSYNDYCTLKGEEWNVFKMCTGMSEVSTIFYKRKRGEGGGRVTRTHASTQPRGVDAVEDRFSLYYQDSQPLRPLSTSNRLIAHHHYMEFCCLTSKSSFRSGIRCEYSTILSGIIWMACLGV